MDQNESTYAKRFQRNYRKGTLRYKISSFWLGYPLEMRSRLQNLFGDKNEPEKKFVIFTSGRSGSTLLVDLLNSNPEIYCDDELLKRRVAFPIPLIKSFEKQSDASTYGFKLLSYQLLNVQTGIQDKKAFLDRLTQEENYKLIHLRRENKAKQALSIIYAFYRGQWHNQQGSKQKIAKRFELDPNTYLHFLKELSILEKFEEKMVQDREHFSLIYEKDLQNPAQYEKTMERLSEFLDVPIAKPKSKLQKVTPSKLSDMISNRDALIEAIRNSDFSEHVETFEKM